MPTESDRVLAHSFAAAIREAGGTCPECGTNIQAFTVKNHSACIVAWRNDVEAMVEKVMLALGTEPE